MYKIKIQGTIRVDLAFKSNNIHPLELYQDAQMLAQNLLTDANSSKTDNIDSLLDKLSLMIMNAEECPCVHLVHDEIDYKTVIEFAYGIHNDVSSFTIHLHDIPVYARKSLYQCHAEVDILFVLFANIIGNNSSQAANKALILAKEQLCRILSESEKWDPFFEQGMRYVVRNITCSRASS